MESANKTKKKKIKHDVLFGSGGGRRETRRKYTRRQRRTTATVVHVKRRIWCHWRRRRVYPARASGILLSMFRRRPATRDVRALPPLSPARPAPPFARSRQRHRRSTALPRHCHDHRRFLIDDSCWCVVVVVVAQHRCCVPHKIVYAFCHPLSPLLSRRACVTSSLSHTYP